MTALALGGASEGHAQAVVAPAVVPFASGTYERWSPLFDAPSGPLAAPPTLLPEWISVTVAGDHALVVVEPEQRVRWRIRYGPHGAEEKRVVVDGVEVLRARYERDPNGWLLRKVVEGPLAPQGLTYTYTTDPQGRVLTRERALDAGRVERLEVQWSAAGGATARVSIDGVERRRDELDPSGRLLVTAFGHEVRETLPDGSVHMRRVEGRLVYRRDRRGGLRAVLRERSGHQRPAAPGVRDTTIGSADLALVADSPVERSEVRLLLGSPVTATDRERGADRALTDDFADGCWMNETNYLTYDATGLRVSAGSGCICGFCVDASQAWRAESVSGVALHWTTGPWLRLDGELIVTGEHEVMTPAGPRRADALTPGDLVLGADGSAFALRSIERLPDELRLGRNVETAGGTFVVGRFVVVSEHAVACP